MIGNRRVNRPTGLLIFAHNNQNLAFLLYESAAYQKKVEEGSGLDKADCMYDCFFHLLCRPGLTFDLPYGAVGCGDVQPYSMSFCAMFGS